jgi:hypothetical protein
MLTIPSYRVAFAPKGRLAVMIRSLPRLSRVVQELNQQLLGARASL